MAATTKFNRLCTTFMDKIGDSITVTGSVIGVGKILSDKERIENYVNRALEIYFYKKWEDLLGNVILFANFFPELIKQQDSLSIVNDVISVTPYKNLFKLLGVRADDIYVRIWDVTKYSIAKSGKRTQYVATQTQPAAILLEDKIEVFGYRSVSEEAIPTDVEIEYIIKPIKADGTAYESSADDEDSPFSEFHNEVISQIAADLYNQDAQNMT